MPRVQKTSPSEGTSATSGWGAVAQRKAAVEESSDKTFCPDFWLVDGETAKVQFLSEEPYCFEGHSYKRNGKWVFEPCQLVAQKHCVLCEGGQKLTWKAAFKILDWRGTWNKDSRTFNEDKQIEKIWKVSNTVALQIKAQMEKRGSLLDLVFEITRTGADKTTSYAIEVARDADDNKIATVDHVEEHPSARELCSPAKDSALVDAPTSKKYEEDSLDI